MATFPNLLFDTQPSARSRAHMHLDFHERLLYLEAAPLASRNVRSKPREHFAHAHYEHLKANL
jgi:hypothetical protein